MILIIHLHLLHFQRRYAANSGFLDGIKKCFNYLNIVFVLILINCIQGYSSEESSWPIPTGLIYFVRPCYNESEYTGHKRRRRQGSELWIFKVENLKNIIMKYLATIGVVGVMCLWVCPGIDGVYVYQVWRT
jgi:hypothetical protein